MNAKELRIGNWVRYKGLECSVDAMGHGRISIRYSYYDRNGHYTNVIAIEDEYVDPIELNPSILEAAGFEKEETIKWPLYKKDGLTFMFLISNVIIYIQENVVDIHYLHQLQNLYYSLTGTELEIKL